MKRMSTVAKADAGAAPETAKGEGKPKKGKAMLIVAVLAVLAAGGGAAFWFLRPAEPSAAAAPAGETPADAAAKKTAPLYYKFDPAFVVNFGSPGNVRYLQIMIEAMSRDQKVMDELKVVAPAIRNDLMLLFSSQQYEDLLTAEGKEKLRKATLDSVRKALAAEGGNPESLESVYFTSLVIQ
jgi:flagellar protein FliL